MTVPLITAKYGWRMSFYVLATVGVLWALVWLVVGAEGKLSTQDGSHASHSAHAPLRPVLKDPTVWGNFLLHFVAYWGLSASLTWLPAYFQAGLGYDNVNAGRLYCIVVALSIPIVLLLSLCSQRLLDKGWSSRDARGRFACFALVLAGLLYMAMMRESAGSTMRVICFGAALGLSTAIYSFGPAMLAQVAPPSRRGTVLALDNSIASLAGVLAPAVSGALIQSQGGAAGFELGFALSGVLMVGGGLLGVFLVNPEGSASRLLPLSQAYEH
jgi:predicted MFS family arabinose efflux permease